MTIKTWRNQTYNPRKLTTAIAELLRELSRFTAAIAHTHNSDRWKATALAHDQAATWLEAPESVRHRREAQRLLNAIKSPFDDDKELSPLLAQAYATMHSLAKESDLRRAEVRAELLAETRDRESRLLPARESHDPKPLDAARRGDGARETARVERGARVRRGRERRK